MFFTTRTTKARRRRGEPITMWRNVAYGIAACTSVVLLVSAVWYVTRLPFLTIQTVVVEGGETVPPEDVRARAELYLNESYLRIIPHRFVYFYPHDMLRETLPEIPRVKDVEITRIDTTLKITYDEYEPFALWCTSGETSECYFIHSTGYAYEKAPNLKGGTLVRHTFLSDTVPDIGETIPLVPFTASHTFIRLLEEQLSLRVTDVRYSNATDVTVAVHGGGEIYITLDETPEKNIENLSIVLASEAFEHIEPGNFQYIDLRFGNKIFVNEELPSPEVATATPATTTEERIEEGE